MSGSTFTNVHKITAIVGFVATLPLVFFVATNVLVYELEILPGWEAPLTHPAILLGGCLFALIVNAWSLFDIAVSTTGRRFRVIVEFTAHKWNLMAFAVASIFLSATILYLFVENMSHAAGV